MKSVPSCQYPPAQGECVQVWLRPEPTHRRHPDQPKREMELQETYQGISHRCFGDVQFETQGKKGKVSNGFLLELANPYANMVGY